MSGINFFKNLFLMNKPVRMNWTESSGYKVQEAFDIGHEKLGKLKVIVKDTFDKTSKTECIKIGIYNNNTERPIAWENLSFFENNTVFGSYMEVLPQYREHNNRLGELLRLLSIAQIAENKVPVMNIYSKSSALFFHTKYKFTPNIQNDEALAVLDIIKSKSDTLGKSFKDEAQNLRDLYWETSGEKAQEEWFKQLNDLADRYLKSVNKKRFNPDDYTFKKCIDMKMTREHLLENKDFFNKKFEAHRLDYEL